MQKLKVWNFCLAFAIVWGAAAVLTGWFAALGWGDLYVRVMSSLYIGFEPSFWGGIIGGIWAFVIAGIFGAATAYLYNTMHHKKARKRAPAKKAPARRRAPAKKSAAKRKR